MKYHYDIRTGVTKSGKNVKRYVAGILASALTIVGLAAVPAGATPPTIMNGSFEMNVVSGNFATITAPDSVSIPGWTVTAGSVDQIHDYWNSSEGSQDLDMSGLAPGTISQTFSTVTGHAYTVTFDMAGNPDGAPVVKTLAVDTGGLPTAYTFDTTGHSRADMGWAHETYNFTATGSNTTLTFTSAGPNNTFYGAALDNVAISLDAPTSKDQCKNDGWKDYGVFKNQGDCVSFVATGGRNLPAGL
ncbi:MAG TPA: choice-of-anchor C family protein [Candidatus Saccharimonadales bacterium]|nr:choice-of-anchor C family protein [Candidatus Saccharimonadales bacterium]